MTIKKQTRRGGKGCEKPGPSYVLDGEKAKEFFGPPPKRRPGRPRRFTPELGATICQKLRAGQTLRSISIELGIDRGTVLDWVGKYPEFSRQTLGICRPVSMDLVSKRVMTRWLTSGQRMCP
jgi:hypothetical protein